MGLPRYSGGMQAPTQKADSVPVHAEALPMALFCRGGEADPQEAQAPFILHSSHPHPQARAGFEGL